MKRLRSFFATYGLDAVIALLAVAAAAGTLARPDSDRPDHVQLWLEVVAVVLMILMLLLRRRAPLLVPASTWLISAALSFVDGRLIVAQAAISITGMVAAVLLGNLRSEREARVGLVVVVICAAAVVYNDPLHTVSNLFLIPVLFAVGWLVGFALHERAELTEAAEHRAARAERERESAARIAVAEERSRIARELHDVVAHAMSVMVLQVGAVRHRMPPDDREDREALQNVERAGRTALTEMRRLLDAMRRDEDEMELAPQPGMENIARLLEDVRAAGLDVQLDVDGEPVPLSPGLDLSAYRILQEGLTNTLKHAHAQHADVHVRYGKDHLELEVLDDGRGPNGRVDHERPQATGSSASVSASRSTVATSPPAVRTIAAGDALLSPMVTRNVIAHFTRQQRQPPPSAVETLTAREMDVYRLIASGLSNAEIGRELFISDTTVKTHVTRLLQKLEARDRAQAIVMAYQSGLFDS